MHSIARLISLFVIGSSCLCWREVEQEAFSVRCPHISNYFDILGEKIKGDGHQGWIVIPDATMQRSYSKKDVPLKLVLPIEAPDFKANFDIIQGEVQILHAQ